MASCNLSLAHNYCYWYTLILILLLLISSNWLFKLSLWMNWFSERRRALLDGFTSISHSLFEVEITISLFLFGLMTITSHQFSSILLSLDLLILWLVFVISCGMSFDLRAKPNSSGVNRFIRMLNSRNLYFKIK